MQEFGSLSHRHTATFAVAYASFFPFPSISSTPSHKEREPFHIPSEEERERLHDFGGHEPEDGEALLMALREEQAGNVLRRILTHHSIV